MCHHISTLKGLEKSISFLVRPQILYCELYIAKIYFKII